MHAEVAFSGLFLQDWQSKLQRVQFTELNWVVLLFPLARLTRR